MTTGKRCGVWRKNENNRRNEILSGGKKKLPNKNATVESCKNFADITNTDIKASNTRVAGIVSALNAQTDN